MTSLSSANKAIGLAKKHVANGAAMQSSAEHGRGAVTTAWHSQRAIVDFDEAPYYPLTERIFLPRPEATPDRRPFYRKLENKNFSRRKKF